MYKNQLFTYNGKGRIYSKKTIAVDDFINDPSLYDKIRMSDFNQFSVLSNYGLPDISRDNLVRYYSERKQRLNDNVIKLYRQLSPTDIELFYSFEVWLEIKGVQVTPGQYGTDVNYPDDVVISFPDTKHWHLGRKKVPAFWEPRIPAHLVPLTDVDKVIGIKRFKDVSWIGSEKERDFTGEEEKTILDLNSFDKNVYSIFFQHEAITVTY